jgi:PhnB protein
MTTKPKPIPDTYRRVTPCLVVQGGAKALEFYAEVFGATERMRFPGPRGTVAHAEIQIGDSVVIIEDESPVTGTKAPPPGGVAGSPTSLFIYVEDVDAVITRAVELGATLQRPPWTSSTATGTDTSWTRSGTDGRSRRTWRTWRTRRWPAGWPSCPARPSLPDGLSVEARSVCSEVCAVVRGHRAVRQRPAGHGPGRA